MTILLAGLGLFLAAFLLHLFVWRVRLPRRPRLSLALIFGGMLVASMAVPLCRPTIVGPSPLDLSAWLFAAVLYGSLFLAYLALFAGLEGDSPTVSIVIIIQAAGSAGVEADKVRRAFPGEHFIRSRVGHLLDDGMVNLKNGVYIITPKGKRFVDFYAFYRRLAGISRQTV